MSRRRIGQVPPERIHRLVHERHAIGEKQHALGPVTTHQQVGERDHRARLAGAGGHDQQRLAVVILLEGLGDAADAAGLIETLDDRRIDVGGRERLAAVHNGAAVLVVSTDTDELVRVAHRVVIMTGGMITDEFAGADMTAENIERAQLRSPKEVSQ